MNVQKRKIGQAIFSHRCPHVVIQSSQCACASFVFDVTGTVQAIWRKMLIFGKRAASQSLIARAGETCLNCGSIATVLLSIDFSIA